MSKFKAPQTTQSRIFEGQTIIHSDCYKLLVSSGNVNLAWAEGDVDLKTYEHCHWFHTYDTDGKKHIACAPVGGHYHLIELEASTKDGEPPRIKSVSGPMRKSRKKVKGKWTIIDEPLPEILEDNHTHEIEYVKSSKVTMRSMLPQAMQLIAEEAQKTAPISGVQG